MREGISGLPNLGFCRLTGQQTVNDGADRWLIRRAQPRAYHLAIWIKHRQAEIDEIVKTKQADLNARDLEHARRMIEGTARSMGIEVLKD